VAEAPALSSPPEPPRGTFQARVDEKGRLKLPADIEKYLDSFGDRKLFITTVDLATVRLYPISVWKLNEKFFDEASDDPSAAEDVKLLTDHFGADAAVDNQGRVLLPSDLRKQLRMENEPVYITCYKGRVNIFSSQVYEQRLQRAMDRIAEKVRGLEQKGFR
jgi:MraZ protein